MSAELLGLCAPFEYRGEHYQVAQRDVFIEGQFSIWVAAEAALALSRLRPRIPADFYAEQMRLYNSKVCGKQFDFDGEDARLASVSDAGRRQLLYLKIARGSAKGGAAADRILIDQIANDKDHPEKWDELLNILWMQDYPDFFAELEAAKETAKRESLLSPETMPPATT